MTGSSALKKPLPISTGKAPSRGRSDKPGTISSPSNDRRSGTRSKEDRVEALCQRVDKLCQTLETQGSRLDHLQDTIFAKQDRRISDLERQHRDVQKAVVALQDVASTLKTNSEMVGKLIAVANDFLNGTTKGSTSLRQQAATA